MAATSYCSLKELPQYMFPPPWILTLYFLPPQKKYFSWDREQIFRNPILHQVKPQEGPCSLNANPSNTQKEIQNKKLDLLSQCTTSHRILFSDCISNIFCTSCCYITTQHIVRPGPPCNILCATIFPKYFMTSEDTIPTL